MDPLLFQRHIAYNTWATDRLLNASRDLTPDQRDRDFGTADKSVLGTLLHLFRSETIWLQRLKGGPNVYTAPADWEALLAHWPALHRDWSDWIDGAAAADLTRTFEYHDLRGNARSNSVWETLLQVVNHGTHHRGQVSGFLRAMEFVPPPLDYIAFVREAQR